MDNQAYLIILIVLLLILIFSFWFLFVKYLFHPIFYKPILNSVDTFEFLENKDCSLVEYKTLTKEEKQKDRFIQKNGITLSKLVSAKSEYKIIAYSRAEKRYKMFWVEIQSWIPPFGKRNLNFIEETNSEILTELQKEYPPK
ncbi:MAG: hypothetical protein IIC74_12360 [Bacteroidetes bacterium]|nr:hypothetical protein [Bacteroidota bacterium]